VKHKKVAVLTGGGCAPGLDPFLVSFVKKIVREDYTVFGIKNGWEGLLGHEPQIQVLDWFTITDIVRSGGTLIGTSRVNPFKNEETSEEVLTNLIYLEVEGLIAAGGDDTLGAAEKFSVKGMNVIGVPKTMDLDLSGTDYSVGFWAYNEAVFRQAVPGFIETLKAHKRVGVLELFGRHSGFTVVVAGITAGACYIAIPELELDLDQLLRQVGTFYNSHQWALVVIGEAVKVGITAQGQIDSFGNELLFQRQTSAFLARQIEQMTGIESRAFQAMHPFRGVPSAYDALIGFRLGLKAAEMVKEGQWGKMIFIQGDEISTAPLHAFRPRRKITQDSWWYDVVCLRNSGAI
jgi:6-phosphofructokinase 1